MLQIKTVQTYLAKQVLSIISEKSNHEITLDRVNVSWLDRASLHEFLVLDQQKDTLIYTKNLLVNYRIWDLLNGEYLSIEEIVSDDLKLHMIKYDSTSELNLTEFINSFKSDSGKKSSQPIWIGFIGLKNLEFQLIDKSKSLKTNQIDFANLNLKIPNFEMSDLEVKSDSISASILQMQGYETNSGFRINDFNSVFMLSAQSLSVDDLDLITPTSHITDSLEFFYSGLDDLSNFVDSVSFVFHFKNSKISKEDFRLISGSNGLKSDVEIDGSIWGKIGDFNIEDAKIKFGDESFIVGGISCFGLPDIRKVFILADLTNAHIASGDIEDYTGAISPNVKRLGKIDFTGSFAGFVRDFVAKGNFETDLGSIRSDINLKIPDDVSKMSYSGNVELTNFNVGELIQNALIQTVNLKADIVGKGIERENANFSLNAAAFNTGINGYFYDSISANGKFSANFFEGTFSVRDPNCRFNGQAQIDLTKEIEVLNVKMQIDTAHVDRLNFSKFPLLLHGKIDVEAKDLEIDQFSGFANIDSALIIFDGRKLIIDSLRLNASFEDSTRVFLFTMPGLLSELRGNFKISEVLNDLPIVANTYALKLNISKDSIQNDVSSSNYKLDFKAEFDGLSRYLDSLQMPIEIPQKALLEASFRKSKNFNVSFFFNTEYINFDGKEIFNPTFELNGSSDDESQNFLTNFIISSDKQLIKGVPETTDLLLEGVWYGDNIDVTTLIKQEATSSDLRIESNIELLSDSVVLKIQPSRVILFDEQWKFNPKNNITILSNTVKINDFEIFDDSELLSLKGIYSDTIPTSLIIAAEDLNLNKVSLFSKSRIDGFLNGTFRIFKNETMEPFRFDGGFQIIKLQLDDLTIGNVIGTADWDLNQKSINTTIEVIRDDFKSIQVKGRYSPSNLDNQLDFDMNFDQADLVMVQPFLTENFSNIGGLANGSLKITGTLSSPDVNGNCVIENGKVTIDYLNTDYTFNGGVTFNPSNITFRNFDLTDRKGAQAQVSGYLSHNYFKDMITKIQIRADNFEFLNTTSLDNDSYYGTAYGTGTIDVSGPFADLLIKANIRTENSTRFFIPVTESTNVSQEEYISFINLADTAKVIEEVRFRGLTLDFDIEVTPDAYCELIFDLKSGDIIRGRGRGSLKLTLDTDGEFHMFGPLEITDGAYNFTMANIISKEFSVTPGSRITWYGDPYEAILDLKATYLQRASFSTLNGATSQNVSTSVSTQQPLLVVLFLTGSMSSPGIDFDIQLQNEGSGNGSEESQLEAIRSNEQELQRQVVSLLFLKRFSPKSNFFDQSQQGFNVGGSASEVLSGQLSYLMSQVDENLEIDVDLASLDKEAFNTLQLRLAYTFFDGRLKVTRGGSIANQDAAEANVLNDIVGDLSVEYSLTKDGKLRAKVFRNTSQIFLSADERIQETGVSLRFVHSFSDFNELLTLKRSEMLLQKANEKPWNTTELKDSLEIQN